jgi:hypothetical protein
MKTLTALSILAFAGIATCQTPNGADVYQRVCATCQEQSNIDRMPRRDRHAAGNEPTWSGTSGRIKCAGEKTCSTMSCKVGLRPAPLLFQHPVRAGF